MPAERAGNGLLMHRHAQSQVYLVKSGTWEVAVNRGSARMSVRLGPSDVFSAPAGAWHSLQCMDGDPGQVLLITGGDSRTRIEWEPRVLEAAAERGWSRDADGYAAPASVLALAASCLTLR
jgi:mannose-6-phosphate isomerase-like protein (cupin superfamily)